MKFWNWQKNEQSGKRILRIYEPISAEESWLDCETSPKQFREELNSDTGDIDLWINSPGGDVFAAVAIYNALKVYAGKVTVKIDALAASSAAVIAMAGDVIEISPLGMIMIHNPTTITAGDAAEIQSAFEKLREIKESIITAYELKTHLSREELSRMMDEETWMNAKKAVELGFADLILHSEEAAETDKPAQIFSQRRAENLLATAFRKKKIVENRRVSAALLQSRLDSIEKNGQEWGKRSPLVETPTTQARMKSGLRRTPKKKIGEQKKCWNQMN